MVYLSRSTALPARVAQYLMPLRGSSQNTEAYSFPVFMQGQTEDIFILTGIRVNVADKNGVRVQLLFSTNLQRSAVSWLSPACAQRSELQKRDLKSAGNRRNSDCHKQPPHRKPAAAYSQLKSLLHIFWSFLYFPRTGLLQTNTE